jgi:hypothetical protein
MQVVAVVEVVLLVALAVLVVEVLAGILQLLVLTELQIWVAVEEEVMEMQLMVVLEVQV